METTIFTNPETWVALAFVAFLGLLVYLKVQDKLRDALDARALKIKIELEQAHALRIEAEEAIAKCRAMVSDLEQTTLSIMESAVRSIEIYSQKAADEQARNIASQSATIKAQIENFNRDIRAEVIKAVMTLAIDTSRDLLVSKSGDVDDYLLNKMIVSINTSKINNAVHSN